MCVILSRLIDHGPMSLVTVYLVLCYLFAVLELLLRTFYVHVFSSLYSVCKCNEFQ